MIRGGLARFHALSCRELETEANLVAERFVKLWCQERQVPLESVNVLVVSDLCRMTKLTEKRSGAIEAFFMKQLIIPQVLWLS